MKCLNLTAASGQVNRQLLTHAADAAPASVLGDRFNSCLDRVAPQPNERRRFSTIGATIGQALLSPGR
jgi:hypothetical protein